MRLFWLSLLVTNCAPRASDTGTSGVPDDTDERGPCEEDGGCPPGRICTDGACLAGDRDNGIAEAGTLGWDVDADGVIEPAGDVDWYALTATDATFVRVQSTVLEESPLNTVVSLYDADGNRIAWEDEHPAGDVGTFDSVCFGYLPGAGTWYVSVEALEHFDGTGDGGEDEYTLKAILVDANDETDSPFGAGRAAEIDPSSWYPFPAFADEADDIDYYALDLAYSDGPIYLLSQVHDDASTAVPEVVVYNSDGDLVLRMIEPTAEHPAYLRAPLGTRYVVGVGDSTGGSGATSWSWTFFLMLEEGAGLDRGAEPDDDVTTSNVVDMYDQEPDIGSFYAGGGEARLETADDEDWWTFEAGFDDAYLSVFSTAQYNGSLLMPRIEVYDPDGELVAAADSVAGDDASLEDLGPFPVGTYAVRVSAVPDSGAEGGEGYFYALVAYATSFPIAEE